MLIWIRNFAKREFFESGGDGMVRGVWTRPFHGCDDRAGWENARKFLNFAIHAGRGFSPAGDTAFGSDLHLQETLFGRLHFESTKRADEMKLTDLHLTKPLRSPQNSLSCKPEGHSPPYRSESGSCDPKKRKKSISWRFRLIRIMN